MKTKKMLLILVLTIVVVVGWFLTVRVSSGTDVIKAQNQLIEQADTFMERKLYVRAITLYKEALEKNSELSPTIQEKLLAAYEEYGDMVSYVALSEKRISSGTAMEKEYITTAEYYIQQSDLESAVEILKKGIRQLDSNILRDYYEEHRYANRLKSTNYVEILPTADNALMPAFNGEKWGYVNENGREVLPPIYDSATPFNSYGYAVVSLDGNYYAILENGDWYGADDGTSYERMTNVLMVSGTHILGQRGGSYSYFNYDFSPVAESYQFTAMTGNACGVAAVQKDGVWGIITDAGDSVVDFRLEDVAINSLGCAFAGDRAMVRENGTWHLIDTEGNQIGNGDFADAKAPESDGYIAVADVEGKWGFIDRNGNQVIPCQYNDAHSFSQHLGAVRVVDDWGYISESNKMVIETLYQSAQPFHNGIAQVGLSEGAALISLDYFED